MDAEETGQQPCRFMIFGQRLVQFAFVLEHGAKVKMGIGVVFCDCEGVGKERFAVAPAVQLVFSENQASCENQGGSNGDGSSQKSEPGHQITDAESNGEEHPNGG